MQKLLKKFMVLAVVAAMFAPNAGALAQTNNRLDRQQILEEYEARRAQAEERAAEIRENIEQRRLEIRAEVEERLSERAKMLAERVADHLGIINDNATDAMLNHLNALDRVLNNLESRTDRVGDATGRDMSDVYSGIDAVRVEVTEARSAVIDQKEKVYTAEIDSMEGAGEVMRALSQELRSDLQDLRENTLKPLHTSMRNLVTELKGIVEAIIEEEGENQEDEE
ncbi:MAG: hypothetical protein WDZ40_01850 [Candidatus Spechtbacterales bacterium]